MADVSGFCVSNHYLCWIKPSQSCDPMCEAKPPRDNHIVDGSNLRSRVLRLPCQHCDIALYLKRCHSEIQYDIFIKRNEGGRLTQCRTAHRCITQSAKRAWTRPFRH